MSVERFIAGIREALDGPAVVTDPSLLAKYETDQRALMTGRACAVLRPRSTAEVVAIVLLARENGVGLVPQGGNTSYCGGATPDSTATQAVVSLERMTSVRGLDRIGFTISVDAGVTLQAIHDAVGSAGLAFGLSLGSQGSCTIGGNIATNAGGIAVLRYGMARDLVLGLEVVLPDGSIFDDMRALRKNNSGYDVKQLFIGSEGSLGIITGAVLKLHPIPDTHATAWVKLAENPPLGEMIALARRESADLITSFEFLSPRSLALSHASPPVLEGGSGGALLVELTSSTARIPLDEVLTGLLEEFFTRGWAEDALIATGGRQRTEMWRRRELLPEDEKAAGGSVKHDISTPLSSADRFMREAVDAVRSFDPALELSLYGHVGDGNIHFNVLVPPGADRIAFTAMIEAELSPRLYEIALEHGGSFSAEYGIGRFKRGLLDTYADGRKLGLIKSLKTAIDPGFLMNRGVLLSE
ncbi:FAD-binding oxidoreductase [Bosea sp. (in: a-proteobacteria)]|jgi:FAD/FMN-containing dehydrogenase|uniref:FAD-binding oxidoreductase n=1 Tax=Bosea sp. (in: a-proteobacteria) TaxID=1871050 RepID=UPI002DDCA14D|nr:FAD-binding oxidoreductase [Bosea sp. (in: a-proteobacteria)]HEV2510290.1 FAD-binding oxidoreductase [Bosea sp. (in: a-proteobacteria)]